MDKILKEAKKYYKNDINCYNAFLHGVEWRDDNLWTKFTEEIPPIYEIIIIAIKNKNKEDGIWLYDICEFYGGDYTENKNWEGKINWETPIYWIKLPKI